MSFLIPMRRSAEHYDLIVIYDDKAFERMRAHDPAQVNLSMIGEPWTSLKLRQIWETHESAEDTKKVIDMIRAGGQTQAVLKFLFRGFEYRPDLGDDDGPYIEMAQRKPS